MSRADTGDSTPKSEMTTVAGRVPEETRLRLKEVAYDESSPLKDVSVSDVIREAINEYLDGKENANE